jgi:hypothetical protein
MAELGSMPSKSSQMRRLRQSKPWHGTGQFREGGCLPRLALVGAEPRVGITRAAGGVAL